MKKIIFTLVAMFSVMVNANAMSYAQAREQALFLTDKMAYELNLSEEQYEAAYEINLDYLMSVNTVDDVYADYWRQRNLDLQYILYDWQYTAYCAASYFYRPIYWSSGYWHFGIYAYYPHRNLYYFSRPVCYNVYRGGHSWRYNGGRSWYVNRVNHYRPAVHRQHYVGMRDTYKGAARNTRHIEARNNNHNRNNSYNRNNVYNRNNSYGINHRDTRTENRYGENRYNNTQNRNNTREHNAVENRRSSTRTTVENNSSNQGRSYGNSTSNSFRSNSGNARSNSSSFSGNARNNTSNSVRSNSGFGGSTRSSSFGGNTRSSSSFSGATRGGGNSSHGSASRSHGGGRR